jgi:hypothetical protein
MTEQAIQRLDGFYWVIKVLTQKGTLDAMMTRFGQKQLIDYEKVVVKQTEQPKDDKTLQKAEQASQQVDRLDKTVQQEVQPRLNQIEKAVSDQQHRLATRQDVDKNLKKAAQATQQAAESAVATQQSKQALHGAMTDAVNEVKTGAKQGIRDTAQQWANGFEQLAKSMSFRLRNPMSTGPATRAENIMSNAFWTGAKTGGATHLVTWLGAGHGAKDAALHMGPTWFSHLNGPEQALAVGGVATMAAGLASWLTGLGTSKGRDRVDYALAKDGKINYAKLDADTPMTWESRAKMANNLEQFAKLAKDNPNKLAKKLTEDKA